MPGPVQATPLCRSGAYGSKLYAPFSNCNVRRMHMELSDDDVREFQELYRQQIGRTLDANNAREEATLLLELVKTLYEPIDSDQDVAFMEEYSWRSRSRNAKLENKTVNNPTK
jgi:hypothetical protein